MFNDVYKTFLTIFLLTILTLTLILIFTKPSQSEVSPPVQLSESVACQTYTGGIEERNMIVDFFLNQSDREILDYREDYNGVDIYIESKLFMVDKTLHIEYEFKGDFFCWKVLEIKLNPLQENI